MHRCYNRVTNEGGGGEGIITGVSFRTSGVCGYSEPGHSKATDRQTTGDRRREMGQGVDEGQATKNEKSTSKGFARP
jgi:hypothetical protein